MSLAVSSTLTQETPPISAFKLGQTSPLLTDSGLARRLSVSKSIEMRLAHTGQVSPLHSPVRAVPKLRHHALTPPLPGGSGLGFQRRRGTRLVEGPQTAVKASTAAVQSQWWIENAELWVEVESEEQFQREVSDPSYDLVVVDFYAAWCNGCKSVYPKLCLLAGDTELRKKVKFVKLNVDKLKSLMRKQGVKALPCVKLFRPSTGPVVQFQATLSRAKHFKHNVEVVLENPDKYFVADPNGFVTTTDTPPTSASEELRKRREAAALQAQSGKLYEKLLQVSTTPGGSAYAGRMARNKFSDHSSADHSIALAKEMFLRQNRDDYGYGGRIDALYATEIAPRMEPNEHYLDYTGSSLYCNSQLEAALTELKSNVFGNPHSANPSSQLTEERIEDARERVLRFFNADPSQYHVVFTRSATASLKIVGETFPWEKTSSFRYLRENHNSVLGVRAYALNHGATFEAVDELWMESWITGDPECDSENRAMAEARAAGEPASVTRSLFAFPAEDNFAGVKYPLRWIKEVQAMSTDKHEWKVLLDAAAFVPSQPLDLTEYPADFVAVSFYKVFGYPTGLGALIIKADMVDQLRKVFWGGGSVSLATSNDNFHMLKCKPSEKLEDGTIAFLDIINLRHGFELLERLGGIEAVQRHVRCLTKYLFQRLTSIRHSNGRSVVKVFGKHRARNAADVQGGIVNFEIMQPDGNVFSYKTVEREAAAAGFHIRTGAECNPGACYRYVGLEEAELEQLAGEKEGCDDDVEFLEVQRPEDELSPFHSISGDDIMDMLKGSKVELGHQAEVAMKWLRVPLGSVRVSLGYMSTFEDVEAFANFVEKTYRNRAVA